MLAVLFAVAVGGVMGQSIASVRTAALQEAAPDEDVLADLLQAVPDDSLAEAYIELAGESF